MLLLYSDLAPATDKKQWSMPNILCHQLLPQLFFMKPRYRCQEQPVGLSNILSRTSHTTHLISTSLKRPCHTPHPPHSLSGMHSAGRRGGSRAAYRDAGNAMLIKSCTGCICLAASCRQCLWVSTQMNLNSCQGPSLNCCRT